jgi:hypothetical protein
VPATIQDTVEVNIAIPTGHPDAEKLYRQGNLVRVIGQLDCRMEYQGGEAVRMKLAEIDAEWATRKETLKGNPGDLRKAEATYRRIRQRFEAARRLFVLAGYAEIVEGEPMALTDTFQARRDFVRNRRAQQDARRARTATDQAHRAANTTARPDAGESIADMPVIGMADVDMHPDAGTTKASKPRRRAGEAVIADALVTANGNSTSDNGVVSTGEGQVI